MEVTGVIKKIDQTIEVGQKGFKKRQLIVTTNEQYPQDIPIDFVQDKTSILDAYKVGQNVSVGINLRGSEWNGKHYVSVQGWKISNTQATGGINPVAPFEPAGQLEAVNNDDLPF